MAPDPVRDISAPFGLPKSLAARVDDCRLALDGWCTREKAFDLCRLVLANNCRTIVEIGVFGGRSMIPMAFALQHLDEGVVFGIEPFQNRVAIETPTNEVNDAWWARVDFASTKSKLYRYIGDHDLAGFAKMIELTSDQAFEAFKLRPPEGGIDLLHIDGSHAPEQALTDAANWTQLLGPRGIVVLDDIAWDTVQQAQRFLAESFVIVDEIRLPDRSYGVYRRGA